MPTCGVHQGARRAQHRKAPACIGPPCPPAATLRPLTTSHWRTLLEYPLGPARPVRGLQRRSECWPGPAGPCPAPPPLTPHLHHLHRHTPAPPPCSSPHAASSPCSRMHLPCCSRRHAPRHGQGQQAALAQPPSHQLGEPEGGDACHVVAGGPGVGLEPVRLVIVDHWQANPGIGATGTGSGVVSAQHAPRTRRRGVCINGQLRRRAPALRPSDIALQPIRGSRRTCDAECQRFQHTAEHA